GGHVLQRHAAMEFTSDRAGQALRGAVGPPAALKRESPAFGHVECQSPLLRARGKSTLSTGDVASGWMPTAPSCTPHLPTSPPPLTQHPGLPLAASPLRRADETGATQDFCADLIVHSQGAVCDRAGALVPTTG